MASANPATNGGNRSSEVYNNQYYTYAPNHETNPSTDEEYIGDHRVVPGWVSETAPKEVRQSVRVLWRNGVGYDHENNFRAQVQIMHNETCARWLRRGVDNVHKDFAGINKAVKALTIAEGNTCEALVGNMSRQDQAHERLMQRQDGYEEQLAKTIEKLERLAEFVSRQNDALSTIMDLAGSSNFALERLITTKVDQLRDTTVSHSADLIEALELADTTAASVAVIRSTVEELAATNME